MPERAEVWKCSYCNMVSVYKRNVLRHERDSCKNHRSCYVCKHFREDTGTVYNRYHGGNPGSTDYEDTRWWCAKNGEDADWISLQSRKHNCSDFEPKETS